MLRIKPPRNHGYQMYQLVLLCFPQMRRILALFVAGTMQVSRVSNAPQSDVVIMLEEAVNVPCWSCSGVTTGLALLTTYIGLLQLLRFRR